jgi:hypothetical protein
LTQYWGNWSASSDPEQHFLARWLFKSNKGTFSIVERSAKGVDLFFDHTVVGQYVNPKDAAEHAGTGSHYPLPCAPDDGKSLGVPTDVSRWDFVSL